MDTTHFEISADIGETDFVTEFDGTAYFWNYLAGLDRNDLIAELIQNDLDQDATHTVISFEQDRLVCEGNGRPVEADGWKRLRSILGAGDKVPAKRNRLGVKNHGLKTAFTIGDEIRLMSVGQAVVQTLYAKGRGEPPYPGASPQPMDEPQAPADGCRVIVRYRNADLEPRQGEAFKRSAVGAEEIEALFRSACSSVPEQFAGIVSPEITPRYEIVLRHWRLGEACFLFSCTKPGKVARRIEIFRRRCTVSGTASGLPESMQEQAARRLVTLNGLLKERAADFFRRGNRFYVEVSWPIDRRGRPRVGTGRFRYPIGYPQDSHEARTGHSAFFNAPFASDNKRHGPIRDESTFKELRAACESLLVDALAHYAIPKWGADGLHPVVPSLDADDGEEATRPLLAKLAKRGALPILNRRDAVELALKGKKKVKNAGTRRLTGRRGSKEVRRYRFVVPATTWARDTIHPALSLLCPRSEKQLDPRVHPDIIRMLADCDTPGFAEDFVTFDENDVFDRVSGEGNRCFGAISDPEREFSELLIARTYLDLINQSFHNGKWDKDKESALFEALLMPDIHTRPALLRQLCSSAPLPYDIPGLCLPPILHPDLVGHPLFRRAKWKLQKFTMAAFLQGRDLQTADEGIRRKFWQWLRKNERRIASSERPKLADLAIWLDKNDRLCRISDLCDPRGRVRSVLADFVLLPHEQVRHSRLVSFGGKARTSIRRIPSKDEITRWLNNRMEEFTVGETPDAATVESLRRFEADLTVLLKDKAIARVLKATKVTLPALAQDGSVRHRSELVAQDRAVNLLDLRGRFLLNDRRNVAVFHKFSPALSAPTTAMMLDTFAEDSGNFSALHLRLRHFLSITEPGDDERIRLATLPIFPVKGQSQPPFTLAFTRIGDNFWGNWKFGISAKGLSQNDQDRYLKAGVTSASPNKETSRAFFRWLSSQDQTVLSQHIAYVLRHILHRDGPTRWAETFTDTPFLPVTGRDGLRLVSLREATSPRSLIYLSDAGEIGDAIVHKDPAVLLVIGRVKEVSRPILEPLKLLGIKSLRESLKEPKNVTGAGNVRSVNKDIFDRLHALRSRYFQRTFLKSLGELGVESSLVRYDWHNRLSRIEYIRFANEVKARYRFQGKSYQHDVGAGFDTETGTFWMKPDKNFGLSSLYEAIARQLVFTPAAKPRDHFMLERTLEMEIREQSYVGNNDVTASDATEDDTKADDSDSSPHIVDDNAVTGEAILGHAPFEPSPRRNIPSPGPILSGTSQTPRHVTRASGALRSRESDFSSRPIPELENKHIEELKRRHYASHCQICLCERPPQELAPTGSYIEWEEVRRGVIDAHHVDPKSGGGARHAGNLILLCKRHHNNYGRRLSRAAITTAFRADMKEISICFDKQSELDGRQIELKLSDTHETIRIFFTKEHADYWLDEA